MALKMLAAYYSRGCSSRELFEGWDIKNDRSFEEHLNRYDVIFLNMQHFLLRSGERGLTDFAFIPNREITGEFENAMSVGGWPEVMEVLKASEKLLCEKGL